MRPLLHDEPGAARAAARRGQLNISRRTVQATATAGIVLMLTCGLVSGSFAAEGPCAAELRRACDGLLERAVKRPYGMAWTSDLQADPADRRPIVEMDAPGTAGAGLVLLWAGDLLKEPRYVEAAVLVARGLAAVQTTNGTIPSRPQFGPTPGGRREASAVVPDRSATRAGLVLMLGAIGADPARDDTLKRSARRAAQWLARQQTRDGGWPSTAPAGAGFDEHHRLIRLDTSDARDTIFALLLSAQALDDPMLSRTADKSVQKLIALRLGGPERLENLWSTFYRLDGSPEDEISDAPAGADVLASRRSMEALIAAAILSRDEHALPTVRDAARALAALRDPDGTWRRLYPLKQDQEQGNSIFAPAGTQPSEELWTSGTFGLDSVLRAADWLNQNGPQQLADHLANGPTLQERMAAAACGLHDEPLFMDWPREAAQVDAYINAHKSDGVSEQPVPAEGLHDRVSRMYLLLLRARLEAQFGKN